MKYLIHFKTRQTPVLSENSCFYKSDTSQMDSIPIEELTITLVTGKYPRKLIHHLKTKLRYQVKKAESGIYYVTGDKIPIQIIVTKELTEAENLWLKSLTNELEQNETAEKLLEEYSKNQANALYRSVMELIVRANKQKFEEVKGMCDALRELMKDEIDAEVKRQVQERIDAEVNKKVQEKIDALRSFITSNYYTCNTEIFRGLGQMYVNDERFKHNIDNAGGEGTAEFVKQAIEIYCSKE